MNLNKNPKLKAKILFCIEQYMSHKEENVKKLWLARLMMYLDG